MQTMDEMKRILLATDFSATATAAFDWAIELARAHGAELQIVHAIETTAAESLPLELQQAVSRSLKVLEQAAVRQHVPATTCCLHGRPWEVVRDVQRERKCDLVVVGARGHTSYAPALLGSRADRVVRMSDVPVVTVHGTDAACEPGLRTVLVGTDFSEEAALATSAAARLLRGTPGEHHLILLHVTQNAVPYEYFRAGGIGPVPADLSQERAESVLESLAAPLRSEGLNVTTLTRTGYPAAIIAEEARVARADLVALGTHGRGGLKRLLLGSIAERVLHHAPCPVLTVRVPEAGEPVRLSAEQAAAV